MPQVKSKTSLLQSLARSRRGGVDGESGPADGWTFMGSAPAATAATVRLGSGNGFGGELTK
jgi:hypothetical protein